MNWMKRLGMALPSGYSYIRAHIDDEEVVSSTKLIESIYNHAREAIVHTQISVEKNKPWFYPFLTNEELKKEYTVLVYYSFITRDAKMEDLRGLEWADAMMRATEYEVAAKIALQKALFALFPERTLRMYSYQIPAKVEQLGDDWIQEAMTLTEHEMMTRKKHHPMLFCVG